MKSRVQLIHFTGIGGIGMSGIAELLHNQGFNVQGSDAADSANVQRLRDLGIPVAIGHAAEHIGNAEVVVVTSAVNESNPELIAARERKIPVIPRAEMLAELMRMKQGIAIAGSHGKTTITSMIAHAMEVAGLDPTYVIGGRLMASGSNTRLGSSPWLVAEADESDGSFLHLSPMITVVSNIDPEHLDHYGNFETLMAAFAQFVNQTPFYGRVVLHQEHPHVASLREHVHKPITTYGSSPQADIHLIQSVSDGYGQALTIGLHDAQHHQIQTQELYLPMPGQHNAENALAAIAVLRDLDIDWKIIQKGFKSFAGIQRRFQCFQTRNTVLVDDYAHHPKELLATLEAARTCWPERHITAIFQPHRYTRTRDLMDEFLGSFELANELVLLPVYAASEEPIEGATSEALQQGLLRRGHRQVSLVEDLDAAFNAAQDALDNNHIVLLMGAGSIGSLAVRLRQALSKSEHGEES
ncbi:MAG: UDP-N-acetylmuramate--L-alanine ligase [Mariprofundaceae bacterium]|nr:UDP-N-acetylmuramate--L-alanine ligase [Mariprofundaceae bacterium]